MAYDKCFLCGKSDATKTNSHLIPSFMIAKACSYDGSGRRDSEVMFSMESFRDRIYIGALPDTKIEELFDVDNLSEDRIKTELGVNPASKDFIFCPKCESRLSKYLESPYSQYVSSNKKIGVEVPYFFWLSVIWRMSISNQFGFRLPERIEKSLGRSLDEYLCAVENAQSTENILVSTPFSYRLIRASQYLPNEQCDGFFYGIYDNDNDALMYVFGDTVICAQFDHQNLTEDMTFLGLERIIKQAPINQGIELEKVVEIDNKEMELAAKHIIAIAVPQRIQKEFELVNKVWNSIGLKGNMPAPMFEYYISQLYSESGKQGDRRQPERYVVALQNSLDHFGYKLKE